MSDNQLNSENLQPPQSEVQDTFVFHIEPRTVDASEGINWITQAWEIVKERLGMWVLIWLIFFIITLFLSFIPLISIFVSLISPVFIGGIISICEKQRKTGEADVGLLFDGFQKKFGELIALGAISFAITLIISVVTVVFGITGGIMMNISVGYGSDPSLSFSSILFFIFLFVLVVIATIFSFAITWFSPALIMNHNLGVGAAISASLKAVKKNLLPGFVFFFMGTILCIIGAIPFGLGLLIVMPIMSVTYYSTYRSLFFSEATQAPSETIETAKTTIVM